jgi:hypothetical protein
VAYELWVCARWLAYAISGLKRWTGLSDALVILTRSGMLTRIWPRGGANVPLCL